MPAPEYPYLPDQVDIYISYTQREARDKEVAEALYNACEAHPRLVPHIDSKDLNLHADIYQYMDKLSAARFVVCVFSKDYFNSINCVAEFAGLCHNGFMHNRVFPLFIDFFFDDNKRNEWMNQLVGDDEAKKRVKKNTDQDLKSLMEIGISQLMEQLTGLVHEDSKEFMANNFSTFIEYFLGQINAHNKERLQQYRNKLEEGIQGRLEHPDLVGLVDNLSYTLKCRANECAGKLLETPIEGLADFHACCKEKHLLSPLSLPVREIAGLLFVATVDSDWWLVNEFALQRGLSRGSFADTCDINHYSIEIVFSRAVARPATYKKKDDKIYSECLIDCPAIPPFSGNPEARKDVLLKSFYETEMEVAFPESCLDEDKLRTLRGEFKNKLSEGKQPFYVIKKNEFDALHSAGIIDVINKELKNLVVFVVIDEHDENFIANASRNVISGDVERVQSFIHKFAMV